MFNATRHGTTLDGVVMRHTGDDIANFHGYWGHIESLVGNRVTFVRSGEFDRTVMRDVAPWRPAAFPRPEHRPAHRRRARRQRGGQCRGRGPVGHGFHERDCRIS